MKEKQEITNKLQFITVEDVSGDKIFINLEKVNFMRVDNDKLKVLFADDENEYVFGGLMLGELEKLNKRKL